MVGMDDHLHGATTTDRLQAAGLGKKAIQGKVRRGELLKVKRRVFRHAATPETPQQLAAIAILAAKGKGAITGAWAVRWCGIEVRGRHEVDCVIAEGRTAPEIDGICYRHSTYLPVLRTVRRHGLAVVELAWAIGDLARDVTDAELARVIARAVAAGKITLAALREHLTRRPKFPGSARLRRVIDQLSDDMPFSGTEKKAARLLREAGMPFVLQFDLVVDGRLIRPGDLVLPEIRFDLELDGPHHWMPEQAAIDRRNDTALRGDDWVVERVPVYDIDDRPELFVAEIRQLVTRVQAMRTAQLPDPSRPTL